MRNYRQDFFDFAPTVYLDCAYQGPFPRATVERIHRAIELKCYPDRLEEPEYFELPVRARNRLADIVGADPTEIALTNSATQGIGVVTAGLGFKAGDEVVVASSNFPSNLFSWLNLRRLGVTVHVLHPVAGEVTPQQVAPALNSRTRVLALDWVSYSTGYRIDLMAFGELIHKYGGILVVDGTQGVGALELELRTTPVDVLAVAAYKWLLGPFGTGFVYLSREILGRLDLPVVNWYSVEGSDDFDALPTDQFTLPTEARVFDVGEPAAFINVHGLEASLEYVQQISARTVYEHCRRLLDRLAEGLRRMGFNLSAAADPAHCSTILCFQGPSLDSTTALHQKLRANHVAVSLRHGMIRVSPYLYNDEADIDRLLELAA
jgi:cysteine desulfurase/selenocysteine lyase